MASDNYAYVEKVAQKLRLVARAFEDITEEFFFELEGLDMKVLAEKQNLNLTGFLKIGRKGFSIDYVNLNMRQIDIKNFRCLWTDTIGSLPNELKIYLNKDSYIEFVPSEKADHLLLSSFWQVFHNGLNGQSSIFQNPIESRLGHRLREVANYLIENQNAIGPVAKIHLNEVKTRIKHEDFSGEINARFPELHDKFNNWRLIEQLGAGAFGQVFKVQDLSSGEIAAIKLMSPKNQNKELIDTNSEMFRLRRDHFLNEADLSLKVSSPFTLSAIDCGKEPWPWILFPFVDGQSLAKKFQNSTDLRALWWNLAHDLISGLASIHQEGLIHKDVKPDNILFETDRFILLDFGIGEVAEYSNIDGHIRISGTYGFMAPELLLTSASSTNPSYEIDIFSAGMTLLHFFDAQPRIDLGLIERFLLETSNIQPLKDFMLQPISVEKAPPETREMLSSMLNFDPSRRPTAKNLLKNIMKFVDIEQKLNIIQTHKTERIPIFDSDPEEMGQPDVVVVNGPFRSWKVIEDWIYQTIETVRPTWFTISLNPEDDKRMVYVQGMSGGGGWYLEAMSENYAHKKQSDNVKKSFLGLNWNPPSSSVPNFSMNVNSAPSAEIIRIFIDAFEFGYGLAPSEIKTFKVTSQGKSRY